MCILIANELLLLLYTYEFNTNFIIEHVYGGPVYVIIQFSQQNAVGRVSAALPRFIWRRRDALELSL